MSEIEKVLKVAASTDIHKLCNSIIISYEKEPNNPIILRAIGAGAVNQAVKATINSSEYFSKKGLTPALVPSWKNIIDPIEGGGERKTCAIEFRIDLRRS